MTLSTGGALRSIAGDAGQPGDECGYRHTGVHQALVALDNAPAFQHDHRHFGGAAAGTGEMPVVSKSMTAIRSTNDLSA